MRILPTFIPPFEALPTRPKTLTPRLQIPETVHAWDAAPGRAHALLVDEGDCQIVALSGTNGFLRQNSLSCTGSRQVQLDTAQFRLHGFVTGLQETCATKPANRLPHVLPDTPRALPPEFPAAWPERGGSGHSKRPLIQV